MCDFTGSELLKQVCWREAASGRGGSEEGTSSFNFFQVLILQPLLDAVAFWENVTAEPVCSSLHWPQKQLSKYIKRALAEEESLLSRWNGRMIFLTNLWADCLLTEVTGIPFIVFVWS